MVLKGFKEEQGPVAHNDDADAMRLKGLLVFYEGSDLLPTEHSTKVANEDE